ncbi:MAG: hypothetical protein QGH21_01000 [Candidatus Poseidoniia archaeon]|jgi:hypothetical protein|nr:hypothetical protein [Candidatus Poseidoniia archaeon]
MRQIGAIYLAFMLLLTGCIEGDDDTFDETPSDTNEDILYEGDDIGECSDEADNDRDGLFDCDDEDCSNSPACKTEDNESNKTDGGDSCLSDSDCLNGEICVEGNCSANSEPAGWHVINLTEEMIQAGDLDSADCGLILLGMGWDASRHYWEAMLRYTVTITDPPVIKVWSAMSDDEHGEAVLPSLYDWRNGALSDPGFYLIDSDDVLPVTLELEGENLERYEVNLEDVCVPSERDAASALLENLQSPPLTLSEQYETAISIWPSPESLDSFDSSDSNHIALHHNVECWNGTREGIEFTNQIWIVNGNVVVAPEVDLDESGLDWGDEITCQMNIRDTETNETGIATVTSVIQRRAPIFSAMISPQPIHIGDEISCDYTVNNIDSMNFSDLIPVFNYFSDMNLNGLFDPEDGDYISPASLEPNLTLSNNFFEKGKPLDCGVFFVTEEDIDGYGLGGATNLATYLSIAETVIIANSAPTLGGVSITPSTGDSQTTFTCTASGQDDLDGDELTLDYTWYADNIQFTSGIDAVTPGNYEVADGQTIWCEVFLSDGEEKSATHISDTVLLEN